jgi:hypothetical protein
MNPQEPPQDTEREDTGAEAADRDHSVDSKLSEELSNWRRKRHTGGRHRHTEESGGGSFQSQSARTIKVRGHETLVIRKAKSASTLRRNNNPEPADR